MDEAEGGGYFSRFCRDEGVALKGKGGALLFGRKEGEGGFVIIPSCPFISLCEELYEYGMCYCIAIVSPLPQYKI